MSSNEKEAGISESVRSTTSEDKGANIVEQIEAEVDHKIIGLDYYENAQNLTREEIDSEILNIRKKLDRRILPVLCVTYCLQFLNKLSLNYSVPYGFREDLGLDGDKYAWVAAIFNFGYMGGAFPANYLLQRLPVAKYTGIALFTWAVLLIAHVGAKNYAGILVLRFLLGLFEACISPNCMNMCQIFYKREDQPFRMFTFLSMNGISTMVGALLGYGLGHSNSTHINKWQLIFLVIGLINLVWSAIFLWVCPDSPAQAKFLSDRERSVLIDVIARNNQGLKEKKYSKKQIFEACLDPAVWLLVIVGLGCGVINGGVSNFSSALITGYGFSGLNATALQLPTGAIEFIVVFGFGLLSLYVRNTSCFSFLIVNAIPLGGLIGIKLTPTENRWALVGCTWLQFIVGAPVIISWILMNANISGSTKKTTATSLWFAFYAAGNIIGANIFFDREAPKYMSAMNGLISCYVVQMGIGIFYYLLMQYRNRSRTKEQGEMTEEMKKEAILNGFKDFTDFENRGFRYAF